MKTSPALMCFTGSWGQLHGVGGGGGGGGVGGIFFGAANEPTDQRKALGSALICPIATHLS